MWKHKIEDDGKILFWKDEENGFGIQEILYKMRRDAQFHRPAYQVFDNRVRYTREEWQKLEKAEQAKEDAKYSFPKARRVIRCEG